MFNIKLTFRFSSLLILLACTLTLMACKKLVDVDPPPNQLVNENVFNNPKTAAAVMSNAYYKMSTDGSFATGVQSVSYICGLYADELISWATTNPDQNQFYKNNLQDVNSIVENKWNQLYNAIYICNSTIEGVTASSLNEVYKKQLIGEAKFDRALQLFYLVNLWGDVPTPLTSDYLETATLPRKQTDSIYKIIINDLLDAESNLSPKFLNGDLSSEDPLRARPSIWTAKALLARVYLYRNDFKNAELKASQIIDQSGIFSLSNISDVFLKESQETIWQIRAEGPGVFNSIEAYAYLLPNGIDNTHTVSLDTSLILSFSQNDKRMINWVGEVSPSPGTNYYFVNKYKNSNFYVPPSTEYTIVFRLAEQYLIRAEARLHQNNLTAAASDINVIRSRAGLDPLLITNELEGKKIVSEERRHELFTEWGHRWFDIKRSENSNETMMSIALEKKTSWNANKFVLPIPRPELDKNKKLTQNTGY